MRSAPVVNSRGHEAGASGRFLVKQLLQSVNLRLACKHHGARIQVDKLFLEDKEVLDLRHDANGVEAGMVLLKEQFLFLFESGYLKDMHLLLHFQLFVCSHLCLVFETMTNCIAGCSNGPSRRALLPGVLGNRPSLAVNDGLGQVRCKFLYLLKHAMKS